jgi:formylglycine-generating enzyme required for sulfatase activity
MIKMKNLWSLLAIMMAAMLSFGLSSCGDDDETNGGGDYQFIQTLKGNKWITRDSSYGEGSNNHAWVDMETWILYFTSDHSGVSYWIQKDYDTDLGNSTTRDYSLFEYTISGNEVELTYEDSYTLTLYYQGGYLTTESMGTIFEPSQMTSNDYEFVRTLGPQSNTSGGITYTYDERTKELKITGSGDMQNYSSGSQPWKDYYIKKVTIGEGITSIGDNAFYNMVQIEEIDLPNSLKKIGKQAFAKTLITEVEIPSHVEEICEAAFADCSYLRRVSFDYDSNKNGSLKTIGDFAFNGCKIKDYMIFPNQLETVGMMAFTGTFTNINLGKNIKSIGMGAFTSSATEGALWINRGNPPTASNPVTGKDGRWSLNIPVGCRANYSTQEPWKNFKVIYEQEKLDNDEGAGGTGQRDALSGRTFTETVNGVSFKMIGVTGGTFNMGSEESEAEKDEKPVHKVTLSSFSIGETEVTQALWKVVMGSNPSYQKTGDNHPVETVTWNDCQEFIRKLNSLTGKNYRLPTEAEWEFAAKGGTKSNGYKYAGSNTINDVAWHYGNTKLKHVEVAKKQANELGLYDMTGNVSEWVNDYWSMDYYGKSPQNNPTGPTTGYLYVLRGGSVFDLQTKYCRNTSRSGQEPKVSGTSVGLRLGL